VGVWSGVERALHLDCDFFWHSILQSFQKTNSTNRGIVICPQSDFQSFLYLFSIWIAKQSSRRHRHLACLGHAHMGDDRYLSVCQMGRPHKHPVPPLDFLCNRTPAVYHFFKFIMDLRM